MATLFLSLLVCTFSRSLAAGIAAQCEEGDDRCTWPSGQTQAQTLMQVKAADARSADGRTVQMSHALEFVERTAERVAGSNWTGHATNLSATEKDALQTILAFIEGLATDMDVQHREDQNEVNRVIGVISTCGVDADALLTGQVATRKGSMSGANASHHTCRKKADEIGKNKTDLCHDYTEYRKFSTKAFPPVCIGAKALKKDKIKTTDPAVQQHMEACLEATNHWFQPLYKLYTECDTVMGSHEDKIKDCKHEQTNFEIEFCSYAQKLEDTCEEQTRCRTSGVSVWDKTKVDVAVSERARKADYEVGEKVFCLFRVFNASNADKPSILDECRNLTIDASKFDITYPDVPAPVPCVVEADRPCGASWLAKEYSTTLFEYLKPEEMETCRSCDSEADASYCATRCKAAGYCCNDHTVGSNQMISCAQACMMRVRGAGKQELLHGQDALCTRNGRSGCSLTIKGHHYSFCQRCKDLTSDHKCHWGVFSKDACKFGAGLLD